jgi:hypothetical protein
MRIVRKYPDANLKRLWINLHTAWISDAQKSTWYTVIHDLTPPKIDWLQLTFQRRTGAAPARRMTPYNIVFHNLGQVN